MSGCTGASRYFAEAPGALGVTHFFNVPVIAPAATQELTKLGTTTALAADRPVVIDVHTDDATMAIPAWGP